MTTLLRDTAPKRNKYNAKRVTLDGYTFDSQAEARRYGELRLLEAAGAIHGLRVHPVYVLLDAEPGLRAVRYEADFEYIECGQRVAEDVKGGPTETPVFRLKAQLFRRRYRDVELRVVKT
jgi:hypothetical protein